MPSVEILQQQNFKVQKCSININSTHHMQDEIDLKEVCFQSGQRCTLNPPITGSKKIPL